MDTTTAIAALAALAQPTRLGVFRRLVAALPGGEPAGEIARSLGVPHNTLSAHLGVLARAGLVGADRDGRIVRYRADLDGVSRLVGFLTRDCCGGRPEVCTAALPQAACCPPEGFQTVPETTDVESAL